MSVELALAASIAPKVALLVGLTGVLALRIRKYRRVISYDPTQDHEFPFAECGAMRGDAECAAGRIRLPQIPRDSTTVFLELVLKPAPGCKYFTPMIVIESPGFRQEHHFERGAQGRRIINLSGLASALAQGPCSLTLHQSWARVATGNCAVWSLPDPLGEDERLLVIAPHPDDAEISAFSLYTRHAARTMIVTVTAGERGHLRADLALEGMAEGCLKGELRTYDSIVVGLWGGIPPERSVNLGYFDSRLEDMRQDPQKPVESASGVKDPNTFRRLNVRPMPALEAATWDSLVEQMLALYVVRERNTWSPIDLIDGLSAALKFSRRDSSDWTGKTLSFLASLRGAKSESYLPHALAEADFRNRRARHIVYGHTHAHETISLDASHADGYVLHQTYFNAGTWRRTYQPTKALSQQEFSACDTISLLAFYQADERGGRAYETWSGTLAPSMAELGIQPPALPKAVATGGHGMRAPHFSQAGSRATRRV